MRRVLQSVLGVLAAMLLLSGCFTVEMSLSVDSDDTVSGTMTIAIDEEMASAIGELDPEGMDDPIDIGDIPEGATVEPFNANGQIGQTVTFADVPLEEFSTMMSEDEDGSFTLTRDGDEYVFTGTFEMWSSGDLEGEGPGGMDTEGMEAAMKELLETASFTVSVSFPGEIVDTNGTVDGTTVTWDLAATGTSEIYARALADGSSAPSSSTPAETDEPTEQTSASDEQGSTDVDEASAQEDSGGFPTWAIVLIVAVVVVGVVAAGIVLARQRRSTTAG